MFSVASVVGRGSGFVRLPRGGLWRHGDFLRLWSGQTIQLDAASPRPVSEHLRQVMISDDPAEAEHWRAELTAGRFPIDIDNQR